MERTYKQELDWAKENEINLFKLVIADNVYCELSHYWWVEAELESNEKSTNELFENICSKVCEVYLHLDKSFSLSSVVEAVVEMAMKHKKDLDDIDYIVVSDYILYGCEDDYE